MNFFSFVKLFMPNGYIIEILKLFFILMDFMGFSFRIFKMISPYQLITKKLNMGFNLILNGFISD